MKSASSIYISLVLCLVIIVTLRMWVAVNYYNYSKSHFTTYKRGKPLYYTKYETYISQSVEVPLLITWLVVVQLVIVTSLMKLPISMLTSKMATENLYKKLNTVSCNEIYLISTPAYYVVTGAQT